MIPRDGQCHFCGESLNPSSPICPSCGRNVFQPSSADLGPIHKMQPQPRSIALTRRNLIIGGVVLFVLLLVVTVPLLVILGANRGESKQASLAATAQPTQIPSPVASTATPMPSPTAQDTTTVTPSATTPTTTPTIPITSGLPCTVDMNSWTGGSPDWTVHNGLLYNDGSSQSDTGPTMIAPCTPEVSNYAVEAKIQVTKQMDYYTCFGLAFRGSSAQSGWQGYKATLCGDNTASIYIYGDDNPLTQAPFTAGTTIHTYRVEVKDNNIKLFIDGNLVDNTTDNRLLTTETGEGVGLYSDNVQLQVNSFRVTALS